MAEAEYRKFGDFSQAIENVVKAEPKRFSFVRSWFADLRSAYSDNQKVNVCEFNYTTMKNSCRSSLIEDNPEKMNIISLAYKKAQRVYDDSITASLNYGSSTVQQNRVTPKEIESRLIGKQ